MKKITQVITFIMIVVMLFGLGQQQVNAADNITKSTVADSETINNWHAANAFDDSTKNVGRIWTDKSVSTGDVTLTGRQDEPQSATIKKGADSDFLVGLSALSATAKIVGETTVSLDIVLVLDVSGSMEDPAGLTDRTKRIDRLKEAVNDFIDSSAKENDKSADENKQSRIAVIKFAGEESDKIGNETYRKGQYSYNYTQVVSGYKAYTSSDKSELQNKVNALRPAGGTLVDNAMELTQKLVNQSKTDEASNENRKNVKRVVIFFTDGVPASVSNFDKDVAERAIKSAKSIKKDADIYTIGIFNNADAKITGHTGDGEWTDIEKANAFMHGLSSNYPNAESYDNLGTRAKDSNGNDATYYKATDASSLKDIFNQIGDEIISSAQSPTEVGKGENPSQAGYITITDQLGDYMQVDDINTLVYANKLFTDAKVSETTDNNKKIVTYTFKEDIPDTNHVYPEGNLKDIRITVEKTIEDDQLQTGDIVTVQIPANLIPLRYYEVNRDGSMSIDETYPMRLFYDVSLKDGVADKLKNPDAQMKTYINANKNENNQVYFYSNQYDKTQSGGESGGVGAYVKFVPAATNDFYYFQNDTVLYTDEACKNSVTDSIDTSGAAMYYYQRDYYEQGNNGKAVSRSNTVMIPGNSNLLLGNYAKKNAAGEYYIPAGTPRTTSLSSFAEDKAEESNVTGTASQSIKPVWNNQDKSVTAYLGNNGRLAVAVPDAPVTLTGDTALRGTKTLTGRDMKENEAFEFTLTAGDDNTQTAIQDGAVTIAENGDIAVVAGAKDGETKEIQFGDVTFTKTGTYTFDIKENVPQTQAGGMTYDAHTTKVTVNVVRDTEDFAKLKASVSYNSVTAGIATDKATFENSYSSSTEAEGGTSAEVMANKILNGRPLKAGEFQFKLATRPTNGSNGTVIQEKQNQENGNISFDSLKYKTSNTAAGDTAIILSQAVRDGYAEKSTDQNGNTVYTLKYRIYEEAAEGTLPNGVSAVTNFYDFTVTVTDNGNGTLTAVTNYPEGKGKFEFVNQYGASGVPMEITGSKTLSYEEGLIPDSITGKFTFTLEALTEGTPMPENTTAVNDAAGNVNFGQITFSLSQLEGVPMDGNGTRTKEFEYKVTESGNVSGVTNDTGASTGKTFNLTLHDDGEGTLTVTRNPAEEPLFSFTNTYNVSELSSSVTDQVKVNKSLTGKELKEKEFRFELLEGSSVIATGTNDADGNVAFDKITYTKPGNHLYMVREVNQGETGITYDDQTYMIHTKITDNGDGTLKAEHQVLAGIGEDDQMIPAEGNAIIFQNSYKAEPANITIEAVKKLEGGTLKEGQFTFQLKDKDGKAAAEVKNKKDGAVRFENLTFDSEGTYEYTISEVNDKQTDVTYDENVYKLTVSVTDDGSGVLSAKVSGDKAIFTNIYKATDAKTDQKTDIDTKPKTPTTDAKTDSKTDIDTKSKTPTTDAKDKAPETGDSSCMALYLVLMGIAAMSGALVLRKKNK